MTHDVVRREAAEKRAAARNIAFQFTTQFDKDRPNLLFGRLFWLVCDLFEQLIWTHKLDDLQGQPITPSTVNWIHHSVRSSIEQLCYRHGLEGFANDIFDWLLKHITINGQPLPLPEKKDE